MYVPPFRAFMSLLGVHERLLMQHYQDTARRSLKAKEGESY
jgi:hypothetical protein